MKSYFDTLSRLIRIVFNRQAAILYIIILVSAFLVGYFEAQSILVLDRFLSEIQKREASGLIGLVLLYLIYFLLDILGSVLRDVLIEVGRSKVAEKIRNYIFNSVLIAKWEDIEDRSNGNTDEAMFRDAENSANTIWRDWTEFLSNLFSALWLLYAILHISNMWITLVLLLAVAPVLIIQFHYAKKINILNKLEREEKIRVNELAFAIKDGVFSYRAAKGVDFLVKKAIAQLKKQQLRFLKVNKAESLSELVTETAYVLFIVIVVIIGAMLVKENLMSLAAFITIFVYGGRITFSMQSLYSTVVNIIKNSNSILVINQFIETQQNSDNPPNKIIDFQIFNMSVNNLSYKYKSAKDYIIRDINLNIGCYGVTAILGESGVGKSTLLEILLKIRKPAFGSIIVGEYDFEDITQSEWLKNVSYVSQNPYIFNDSVYENILFGRVASMDEITLALRRVGLEDWVKELEFGIMQKVGSDGVQPSGGQVKRLAIARALIGKPKLMIFDEPTANLDSESREKLLKIISQISQTTPVIITTHDQEFVESLSCSIVYMGKRMEVVS